MAQDELALDRREILSNQKDILGNRTKLARLLSYQSATVAN